MKLAHQAPLQTVSYPRHYDLVRHAKPGSVTTVEEALRDAVRLSQASAEQFRDDAFWGRLVNGPYAAIRLAVKRQSLYRLLHGLRETHEDNLAATVLALSGLVVGLGANESNAAHYRRDSAIYDPSRHGEMVAIRSASQALGIPLGMYREVDLAIIEVASCQNCPMCRETNNAWAGTALSVFVCDLADALHYTDEGYGGAKVEAPPTISWGVTDYWQPALKMSELWVGEQLPELREEGRRAMSTFRKNGGKCYQPS